MFYALSTITVIAAGQCWQWKNWSFGQTQKELITWADAERIDHWVKEKELITWAVTDRTDSLQKELGTPAHKERTGYVGRYRRLVFWADTQRTGHLGKQKELVIWADTERTDHLQKELGTWAHKERTGSLGTQRTDLMSRHKNTWSLGHTKKELVLGHNWWLGQTKITWADQKGDHLGWPKAGDHFGRHKKERVTWADKERGDHFSRHSRTRPDLASYVLLVWIKQTSVISRRTQSRAGTLNPSFSPWKLANIKDFLTAGFEAKPSATENNQHAQTKGADTRTWRIRSWRGYSPWFRKPLPKADAAGKLSVSKHGA